MFFTGIDLLCSMPQKRESTIENPIYRKKDPDALPRDYRFSRDSKLVVGPGQRVSVSTRRNTHINHDK